MPDIKNKLRKALFTGPLLLLSLAMLMASCREIYEPELSVAERHLVVDAVLTDQVGPHRVRLSYSRQFGDEGGIAPVTGAVVYISDSYGNEVQLTEAQPGVFYTPDGFRGEQGESYVLNILKENGDLYRSEPQKMNPPPLINRVFAEFDDKLFFYESEASGEILQREVAGVSVFMDVSVEGEERPRFRFETELYMQYEVMVSMMPPVYDFCWRKRYINDVLHSDIGLNTGGRVSERNQSAFLPVVTTSMRFLGFPLNDGDSPITYTHPRVLNKTIYSITESAYSFHHARNQQLGDEGSLFDPIAPQLPTNISNISNPEEIVVGFFEVASSVRATYNIMPRAHIDTIEIEELDCMHDIPNSGCSFNEHPDWWI